MGYERSLTEFYLYLTSLEPEGIKVDILKTQTLDHIRREQEKPTPPYLLEEYDRRYGEL